MGLFLRKRKTMSYRSMLVLLDDSKCNTDRLDVAMSIAKSHGAHLTGVALETLKPQYMKSTDEHYIKAESKRVADSLVNDFMARSENAGIEVDGFTIEGNDDISAGKMAHHGRNVDLVILPQPNPDSRNYSRMLSFSEEVMLYSGRPILFMPYIGAKKVPFQKAMVSYDGTPAATRAIHDAIPILKRCNDTAILVVESQKQLESKSDVQADSLSKHLDRHGIHNHVSRVNPGRSLVPAVIQNESFNQDIDILVVGGYGTPSLRQKIFGSVTRNLLETMPVPVLMAH